MQSALDAGQNPEDSPLFKARKVALERERNRARNQFLRSQQSRGISKSTPTDVGLGELDAITSNQIALALGEEFDKIINRQQSAIQPALAQARKKEGEPIQTATEIARFGSVLKSIEQEPLDFDFDQFTQESNFNFDRLAPIANLLLANPETFYFPQFRSVEDEDGDLSGIGRIAGTILGTAVGGPGRRSSRRRSRRSDRRVILMARLLNRPPAGDLKGTSFDPSSRFGKNLSDKLGEGFQKVQGTVENQRVNNRDRAIIDSIINGQGGAIPEDPTATAGATPDGSLLSKIVGGLKGVIDTSADPASPTDLEVGQANSILKSNTGNNDFEILKEAFRQIGKEEGFSSQEGFADLTPDQRKILQQKVMQRAQQLKSGVSSTPVTVDEPAPEPEPEPSFLGQVLDKGREVGGKAVKGVGSQIKKGISSLLDALGDSEPDNAFATPQAQGQTAIEQAVGSVAPAPRNVQPAPVTNTNAIEAQATQTAVNPQTGEKIFLINNRWVNAQGKAVQ